MLQNRKARRSRQCQIIQPVQLFAEITAITPALTCKTRDAPSRQEHPERWPSGLRRTLGKRVCGKPYRGFESHSLRQQVIERIGSTWRGCNSDPNRWKQRWHRRSRRYRMTMPHMWKDRGRGFEITMTRTLVTITKPSGGSSAFLIQSYARIGLSQ